MLSEVKRCQQVVGEPRRRWFSDEDFDLIVWYNPDDSIYGFQLCYDKLKSERALTWIAGNGYTHRRVDTGEMYGARPDSFTPILVPDGHFACDKITSCFLERSELLGPELIALVVDRIRSSGLP